MTKDNNSINGGVPTAVVVPVNTKKDKHKKKVKDSNGSAWKTAALAFTENTTLHGVRFIFMEKSFMMRRAVWLLLFALCSVLMMIQIVERIVFFYNYPLTVNVQVNYNKTLAFPAITICNQNTFRATAAADKNVYRLLETIHDSKYVANKTSFLYEYGAENFTLEYIFLATTHLKEDLIEACEWQEEVCGPENFTEILTDHGVCYTFNHDAKNPLWAISAGSDFGLRLTLNVEQYEYMPGPHNSAGVKILLHDQNEFPKVAELGLAIPTGAHTFVGIQMCTIQNLPEPHGFCRSMKSPYYGKYTTDACQMACTTVLMGERCGCRNFYMPHVNGNPPVCTLQQFYGCYLQHIGQVKAEVRDNCDCPVPCDFLLYDPTVSFATMSVYATDDLLATTSTGRLKEKFHAALETTSRIDRRISKTFQNLEQDARTKFETVCDTLNDGIRPRIYSQKIKLRNLYDEMQNNYKNKSHLLHWQAFHVRKNFVRARNAMEERTLSVLAHSYQQFSFEVENGISLLSAKNGNESLYSDSVRTAIYLSVDNLISSRVDLAARAFQNYTQLYNAYDTGMPIFRYVYQSEITEDNYFITPRPILKMSLKHNDLAQRYCGRVGADILRYREALWNYSDIAKDAYQHGTSDAREVHKINVKFLASGRSFYHSKSVFYSECVEFPLRVLLDRVEELDRRWREFKDNFDWLYNKIEAFLADLDSIQNSTLEGIHNIVYLKYNSSNNTNITKLQIAEEMISEKTLENISDLKNFMSKIRSRGQSVYDDWMALVTTSKNIWHAILGDEDLYEFYTEKNLTEYLRDYEEVAKEVTDRYIKIREECDFRYLLDSQDSLFLNSLQKIIDNLRSFHDNSQLDTRFIRNNFLQLDIFYREKSYEQIKQQRAYDIFALLCDIGGSMGLFLGASFLTLYEILDFGLHHCLLRLFNRCPRH